jgi:hypothetical protein
MLRFVLRDIARAAFLASLVVGPTACSSSIDRDGFESSSFCTDERARLEALRASLGADWVGIIVPGSEGESSSGPCTEGVCASARDAARAGPAGALNPGQAGGSVLVIVKGDDVRSVKSTDELASGLGAIDSPEKVQIVMWAHGYRVSCTDWLKRTGGGFEAIGVIMTESCDPIIEEEHRVAVRGDATISILERVEVEREDGTCVGRRPAGLVSRSGVGRSVPRPRARARAARCAGHVDRRRRALRARRDPSRRDHGSPREALR